MGIAGRDMDDVVLKKIASLHHARLAAGSRGELSREMRHEDRRQMLGDQDGRADLAWKRAQEFEQGRKAAGRGGERDAAERSAGHVAQPDLGHFLGRRGDTGFASGAADAAKAIGEDQAEAAGEITDAGLGQGIGGAKG
jgi:hypothetical protein